jgi:hypothetical protein
MARSAALGEPGKGQLLGREGDVRALFRALAVIVRIRPSDAGGSGELSGSSQPFPSWLCFADLQYVGGLGELTGAPGGGRSRPARSSTSPPPA